MFQALDDLEGRTEDIPCVVGDEHLWTSDIRHQLSVSVAQRTEKKPHVISPGVNDRTEGVYEGSTSGCCYMCVYVCVCMHVEGKVWVSVSKEHDCICQPI